MESKHCHYAKFFYYSLLLLGFMSTLIWSGIEPVDRLTWILEVLPGVIGLVIVLILLPFFRFTPLVYGLLTLNAIFLFIGGHYTYAEVPFFSWIQEVFHHTRNNYDKLVHFIQGFVPALVAREIIIRRINPKRGWLLIGQVLLITLGVSAACELIEWAAAMYFGESADKFLGMQGDEWDTQSDIAMAFLGALSGIILLSLWQDRQIKRCET